MLLYGSRGQSVGRAEDTIQRDGDLQRPCTLLCTDSWGIESELGGITVVSAGNLRGTSCSAIERAVAASGFVSELTPGVASVCVMEFMMLPTYHFRSLFPEQWFDCYPLSLLLGLSVCRWVKRNGKQASHIVQL